MSVKRSQASQVPRSLRQGYKNVLVIQKASKSRKKTITIHKSGMADSRPLRDDGLRHRHDTDDNRRICTTLPPIYPHNPKVDS